MIDVVRPSAFSVPVRALAFSLLGLLALPAVAGPPTISAPQELTMKKAGSTTKDLRTLPQTPPRKRWRPEREAPKVAPIPYPGTTPLPPKAAGSAAGLPPVRYAPAPSPSKSYVGLDRVGWGAGFPPDPNGDVGPSHFIETVNTSIGIYDKSNGTRLAAFTFDTFMSQGAFGNLCDTDNFGDPVVLYDSFEDRWVISDFAFQLDGSNNVINPPGAFECLAVSKTGDPISGGWNFYSINTTGGLGDYPKLGIWPDGIYMSVNMFDYAASGSFQTARLYAFNKAQMYAGAPSVQVVAIDAPAGEFTLLPANARLQTGTPPAGSPNYFSVVWNYLNVISVYKFHVDWSSISTSTLTGPFHSIAPSSWANAPATVAQTGTTTVIDTLAPRLMMQNQYTNILGVESLWNSHTVLGSAAGLAGSRYYQVTVTGGTVAGTTAQAATHSPDTTVHRFMPSLAVDRAGDMALAYSASNASLNPAIRYAGRLSTDPVSTLPQTETTLIAGSGSQTGTSRWGDYSSISIDPDGCTFWMTNEYYAATGTNWQTRFGAFAFPSCTMVGSGTVQGTVTATVGGTPISGATVALGSRTATTNASGIYSFTGIAAGTYPSLGASAAGYLPSAVSSLAVTTGGTTVQNFALGAAPTNACPGETTQADFQTGVPSSVDLSGSPGNVILAAPTALDQQNTSVTIDGYGFTSTSWFAQSFTAGMGGQLERVDVDLFCSGCTGTTPNVTVSIRATSGDLPTGADLASATIPGFSSGAGGYYAAVFASPATLTAGTKYAIVVRAASNPSSGTYAYVISSRSPYAGGRRSTSSNSGGTWAVANPSTDIGFKTYMKAGYTTSGTLVSSLKDSNPAVGWTPSWTTLSWTSTVPASTTLRFQAAASNSAFGPFSFVGPDGTAATYFTSSPASLSQFAGFRYLKYKAYLTTTNTAVTPTLNDVTACYCTKAPTPSAANSGPVCAGGTLNLSTPTLAGATYAWTGPNGFSSSQQNPSIAGATTAASGTYSVAVTVGGCTSASGTTTATVNPVPATPTISASGPTTFCTGGSVTLTSSGATGNQWYLNGSPIGGATSQSYGATANGSYTVTVSSSGCTSAASAATGVVSTGSIGVAGATTLCRDSLGGTATVTAPASGSVAYQWGYRTTTGGAITDLAGRTAPSYTLQGSDFPSAATYLLVCTMQSTTCGRTVSNEVPVVVDPAGGCGTGVANALQVFTLTTRNNAGQNVLQWVNPASGAAGLSIRSRSDGTYPTGPYDGLSSGVFAGAAAAGAKDTATDGSLANGTTYRYSAFTCGLLDCTSGVSAAKVISGRPFNDPLKVRWAYSTGAFASTPPGLRAGTGAAVLAVSNDRYLHSVVAGNAGGSWPVTWTPLGMNASAQGRAIPVTLTTSSIGGIKTVAFVASQDGRVYAVNSATGALLWTSPVLGQSLQASPSVMFTDFGGVANLVFVGTRNSTGGNALCALNAADGTLVWTFDNGGGSNAIGIISGQAAVDNAGRRVFFTSRAHGSGSSDTAWALNVTGATTFTKAWSIGLGDVDSSIAFSNATLYVGTIDGRVHALIPATGASKWLSPFATGDGAVKGTVWPSAGRVFVSTDTKVWAINDLGTGTTPTSFFTSPISTVPNPATPVLLGTRLYVGGGNGTVYEFEVVATPPTPKSVVLGDPSAPFQVGRPTADVANGLIYMGTESGQIYAVAYPF